VCRTIIAGPSITAGAGEILSLDDGLAQMLVTAGYAELVSEEQSDHPGRETANLPAAETAMSRRRKRR
jgi:hypothetical protein